MTELYLHIPFCKKKCAYCSFYSLPSTVVSNGYVAAMIKEINSYSKEEVSSVYFGGGTPSLLSKEQLYSLLDAIKKKFVLINPEISIECNPDTFDYYKFEYFKKIGINRVSIGVQSLDNETLNKIGRIHSAERALECVSSCRKLFDNVNVDYIVGLPDQNCEKVKKELNALLDLGVSHVSVYSLILEEETPLFNMVEKGEISLPDDDYTVEMYDVASALLKERGFDRYEISNFAKKGYECKHNSAIWRFGEYIGIGAAAHSFYKGKRFYNVSDLHLYEKGDCEKIIEEEAPSRAEYVMLALRTRRGIIYKEYLDEFNSDFQDDFKNELESSNVKTACEIRSDGLRIREEYFYVSNSIILSFIEKYI